MVVTQQNYIPNSQLVIKVLADAFESDPDVFIDKTNKNPSSSSNSQWYCERDGSETCVMNTVDFKVGDTLNIGIKCVVACSYKLKAQYVRVIDLADSERT